MTDNAPRNETQIQYHRRRCEELKKIRQPWESVWTPLAEFIEPTRLRLNPRQEGALTRKSIIDSTGTFALRTLQSGMHSGITSPARPWFRLTTFDPDLKDYAPVKEWLAQVEKRMREVFQSSNVYPSFHTGYGDLGQFGQSCGLLAEDDRNVVRMQQLMHGRFWLARDENGVATTLYRAFDWSVQRIVNRFKGRALEVSNTIRTAWDAGRYDEVYTIYQAVEPRMNRNPNSMARADKPFLSNYWIDATGTRGVDSNGLLEESGFDENPIIAPAWELAAEDHYAMSPGQIALSDVKMLQKEQSRKLEGIDKLVRPPMTGPTSMRNNPASLLPGAVTYVDDPNRMGFRPAMEVRLSLGELREDIRDVQDRIRQSFYADLFLMLSNMEGIQPRNSFEIAERKEEKLLALGPVLENIYGDQLEPTIDRTFNILSRRGELPPAPPEIQEQELQIEYVSILAQAQKAVSTGGLERLWAFAGNIAAVKPEALDKLNADDSIDNYADYLGVDPNVLVSSDEVDKLRKARAQQQQQAQQAATMAEVMPAVNQGAQAAAVLSEAATLPGGSALTQRLGLA